MKFALISPFPPLRGGISKETETIYDYFNNNGHEVKVINFKRLYPNFLFPGKSQYLNNDLYKNDKNIITLLDSVNPFTWRKVSKYIIDNKINRVIFRYWHPFFILSYLFIIKEIRKNKKNVKIFCICDNIYPHSYFPLSKLLIKYFLNSIDKFFVMSENTYIQIKKYVDHTKIKKIFLPTKENFGPILEQKFCHKKLNIETDFTILFFGLIRDYKGLDVLLNSLSHFKKIKDNFNLIIAGECYSQKKKYLELINNNELQDNIVWDDFYIPDEDVNLYFSACDIVVLPYKKASQSGIIPISYNYNKLVVSSDIAGLREFIIPGDTGYLFNNNCPQSLFEALRKICFEHDFNRSNKFINKHKKQYTIDKLANDIISFIN